MFTAPTLQVLWSSKVKFVSLSWLLGRPLFGSNSDLFRAPGFIVSPVGKGEKKEKKKERKKGIEKERKEEGIKKERRTERKKELKNKEVFCLF